MRRTVALIALLALAAAGCAGLKGGRPFPSPAIDSIVMGKTNKAQLERVFGEPYQVGIDSGDPTWRWFYVEKSLDREITKDLTVRFNADGTVKSYSFVSNFPDDMRRLK